jgi:hypothetical protein
MRFILMRRNRNGPMSAQQLHAALWLPNCCKWHAGRRGEQEEGGDDDGNVHCLPNFSDQ